MTMKASDKLRLARIKTNAIKLRVNSQIPSYLMYLINKLDENSSIDLIKSLMGQCEHLLRVKGYYKKYPTIEKQVNEELKKLFD